MLLPSLIEGAALVALGDFNSEDSAGGIVVTIL